MISEPFLSFFDDFSFDSADKAVVLFIILHKSAFNVQCSKSINDNPSNHIDNNQDKRDIADIIKDESTEEYSKTIMENSIISTRIRIFSKSAAISKFINEILPRVHQGFAIEDTFLC